MYRPRPAVTMRFARLNAWLRTIFLAVGVVLLACVGAIFITDSAQAKEIHALTATITGQGTDTLGGGSLSVAVDNSEGSSHGAFYVTDPEHFRVEKFNTSGQFVLMFGKEVNQTEIEKATLPGNPDNVTEQQENICTASSADECKSGAPDGSPGGFIEPHSVAVDSAPGSSNGDVYVAELEPGRIEKFTPQGALVFEWTGSGELTSFPESASIEPTAITVDSFGHLWVINRTNASVYEFNADETPTLNRHWTVALPDGVGVARFNTGIGVDSTNNVYLIPNPHCVEGFTNLGTNRVQVDANCNAQALAVDPSTNELYVNQGGASIARFGADCSANCSANETFGAGQLEEGHGLAIDSLSHTVYVGLGTGAVAVFSLVPAPDVVTGPAEDVEPTTAVLSGTVNPQGTHLTECAFEYGEVKGELTQVAPCEPEAGEINGSDPVGVHAALASLHFNPGLTYYYRLSAKNANGPAQRGAELTFTESRPPSIESYAATHLTATTADLTAQVDPEGADTTCRFEFGTTTSYGQSVPCPHADGLPEADIGASNAPQAVTVHLAGLSEGTTYHFRVFATNKLGEITTEDQAFSFSPPDCPNAILRQQTGASYLPDCRSYELVSPPEAGNVVLFQGFVAPNAVNPTRLAFTGGLGAITGTNPTNGNGVATYVATRTSTGWITHYVGILGDQHLGTYGWTADESLSEAIDFALVSDGEPVEPPSNAPYVFSDDGESLGRWPAGVSWPAGETSVIPDGDATHGAYQPSPDFTHLAFSSNNVAFTPEGLTTGVGSAYDYDTHTRTTKLISLTPSGNDIPNEPGDGGVPAGEGGNDAGPGGLDEHQAFEHRFIGFPGGSPYTGRPTKWSSGVSTDGFRILMSTSSAPLDFATHPLPPTRLYMRVNDAVTYDVSESQITHQIADVNYIGNTADDSQVFFTSEEHLTAEDPEHVGAEIYMWSAKKAENQEDPLTLISKGESEAPGAPGNTGNCHPELIEKESEALGNRSEQVPWVSQCGVAPVGTVFSGGTFQTYMRTNDEVGPSGSDSPIAAQAGDIYFYSPEQLDADKGVVGAQNLYVYREGHVQFVAALSASVECNVDEQESLSTCPNGPLSRIQVSPNGEHMAFVTSDRVTAYNNAGFFEMYTYTPATGRIQCVSCLPDGEPPSGNVEASQGGIFMSNDGRTFFDSPDALVPADTDQIRDVYEFVSGRPQLITSGTGAADALVTPNQTRKAGLAGVSADGGNVYFSTYETLAGQDKNGQFLKFYDARTNGGFAYVPPSAPCAAADECHGAGSEPPSDNPILSEGDLGFTGNAGASRHHRKPKKTHQKHGTKRHRHRGGSR